MPPEQLSLFESPEKAEGEVSPPAPAPALTGRSSISAAIRAFTEEMQARGFTENTQEAFGRDLRLLADYLGAGTPLRTIGTAQLKAFLRWMKHERGIPCSDRTLARRTTTLKVFFGWLAESGVLPEDPAAPIIYKPVERPAPEVLTPAQIETVLAVTQAMRSGATGRKPDPRPHTLVTLLLHSGIKKSECIHIHVNHLDLSDPQHPQLWIRYSEPRYRYKERRIELPGWWTGVLRDYLQRYEVQRLLFPWTARNLEYVLKRVGKEAELPRLTFEMLRWTCALRDYVGGMEHEALRRKLGLSRIRWAEWEPMLAFLAQRYEVEAP